MKSNGRIIPFWFSLLNRCLKRSLCASIQLIKCNGVGRNKNRTTTQKLRIARGGTYQKINQEFELTRQQYRWGGNSRSIDIKIIATSSAAFWPGQQRIVCTDRILHTMLHLLRSSQVIIITFPSRSPLHPPPPPEDSGGKTTRKNFLMGTLNPLTDL